MLIRPARVDEWCGAGDAGGVTAGSYPWTPVDPLGEALHSVRMHGTFYCRSELTAPWALEMPAFDSCLSFHVVTSGGCWLDVDQPDQLYLRPSDLALVPHGKGHLIRSEPGVAAAGRVDVLPQEMVSDHYSVLRYGAGGAPSVLVCGVVEFGDPTARRLLDLLPAVIHIDGSDALRSGWIRPTIALMAEEAGRTRPGGEAVITRLADILVIQGIRAWLEHDATARQGWLYALRDEQIGQALALVHRSPDTPWTVASLAREVAMSRSAFAARFTELVGEPVMRYLARWRMDLASAALAEGATVGELASRLGYESEAAFSRAYKRIVGQSPAAAARQLRDTTQSPKAVHAGSGTSPGTGLPAG